ncbi:hypothetical protein E2C01_056545 [Portunus trituberculatus]|uniref:GIY-YIG domain-containing protein n=1 Tax=Portunus trituberculatus TaxID=210409 RepID=A0A5B7GR31_PORTR|nr:hypothetical protein [Portunus trituberculatus]
MPTRPDTTIKLIIYYQSRKTSQLLIKNKETNEKSATQEETDEKSATHEDHVTYEHKCNNENCRAHTYIGMTRTSLSRRLTCHLKNGAIHEHYSKHHQRDPTLHDLVTGNMVLDKEKERRRLTLLEAIYIALKKPNMNHQTRDLQTLPTLK